MPNYKHDNNHLESHESGISTLIEFCHPAFSTALNIHRNFYLKKKTGSPMHLSFSIFCFSFSHLSWTFSQFNICALTSSFLMAKESICLPVLLCLDGQSVFSSRWPCSRFSFQGGKGNTPIS